MGIEIVPVNNPQGLLLYNRFPELVYRGTFKAPPFPGDGLAGNWRDALFGGVKAQLFLAFMNGKAAGRIAAALHAGEQGREVGYFGYFETLPRREVTRALLAAAADWLADRDVQVMVGPVDLTPHERVGLLVEGFEEFHLPGMPYNPPYYRQLLEAGGLELAMELRAYAGDLRQALPERLVKVAERAAANPLRLRELDVNNLASEGEVFSLVHNGSMPGVWGFVPLSPAEGAAIWHRLIKHYDPALILVAEMAGRPAGLCLTLAAAGGNPGRPMARFRAARLAVLAVLPEYRFKGVEAALILEAVRRLRQRKILLLELSQVAASNRMMNKLIRNMGVLYCSKIYHVYQRRLPVHN